MNAWTNKKFVNGYEKIDWIFLEMLSNKITIFIYYFFHISLQHIDTNRTWLTNKKNILFFHINYLVDVYETWTYWFLQQFVSDLEVMNICESAHEIVNSRLTDERINKGRGLMMMKCNICYQEDDVKSAG